MVDFSHVAAGCRVAFIRDNTIRVGVLEETVDGALMVDGVPVFHRNAHGRVMLDQHVTGVQTAPLEARVVDDPGLVERGDVVVWRQYVPSQDRNRLLAVTVKRVKVTARGYARMWFGVLVGGVEFRPDGNDLFLFAFKPNGKH